MRADDYIREAVGVDVPGRLDRVAPEVVGDDRPRRGERVT
jgi:hypothetical protein